MFDDFSAEGRRGSLCLKISVAAIEGGLLEQSWRDYLFLNGKAVGVLEAKREELITGMVGVPGLPLYARSVPSKYQTEVVLHQLNGNIG